MKAREKSDVEGVELIDQIFDVLEISNGWDCENPDGRWCTDGHSETFHAYCIMTNARAYLIYQATSFRYDDGFYNPLFTRDGENYEGKSN